MIHWNPHLHFDGRCEEAFRYYARHLGATVTHLQPYEDEPELILHATLTLGTQRLTGADVRPGAYRPPDGFSILLNTDQPEDADRFFAALSAQGTVTMPLQQTFWAVRFGMVTDQFGTPWMINCSNATSEFPPG